MHQLSRELPSIGAAIGRIPSGCSILTVAHAQKSTGVLVSWVQQAAFEPPSLSVCVKRGRPAGELIDHARRFVLNIIGDEPTAMFKHFGRGFSLEEDAFAGIATAASDYGPILLGGIAHLACEITGKIAVGDHDLYVVHAVAGSTQADAKPYVHLRKSGLNY